MLKLETVFSKLHFHAFRSFSPVFSVITEVRSGLETSHPSFFQRILLGFLVRNHFFLTSIMVKNHPKQIQMRPSIKPACPAFCTSDSAAGVGRFGGQKSPENDTSSAAEVEREEQLRSKSGAGGGVGGERSPSCQQGSCSGPDLRPSDIWFFPGWPGSGS